MSNWLDWMKSKLEPAMEPPTGHDEWPAAGAIVNVGTMHPSPVPGCADATWVAYENLLALREGVKYKVYYDSLGKPTGGIGHLLLPSDGLSIDQPIPEDTVQRWFQHDGATAMDHAVSQAKTAGITSQAFLPYLASVCYQLGGGWVSAFPRTWGTLVAGNYAGAAASLLGTKWYRQTPTRVQDFMAALMKLPPKP